MKTLSNELKTFKRSLVEVQAIVKQVQDIPAARITCARDATEYLKALWPVPLNYREAFIALYLNNRRNTVSYALISVGGLSYTVADPKVIFQHALLSNATSMILAHNHPSGNLKPSNADLFLTKKIKEASNYMDIALLDHIILAEEPGAYYSMADNAQV